MSLAREDAGDIRKLQSIASGSGLNHRDASGGTRQLWQNPPTKIKTPRNVYSGPYSGRMTSGVAPKVAGRGGRVGSSSAGALRTSPRHVSKRQKLDNLEFKKETGSKYFNPKEATRHRPPQIVPSTSTSSHHSRATAEAAIIVEDDAPASKDDEPQDELIMLAPSSPDPMDIITEVSSHTFDLKGRSPLTEFSSTWKEEEKLQGGDGASTRRVRKAMQDDGRGLESASCTDGDGDDGQPEGPIPSTSRLTPRAGMSSLGSNVREKVAFYDFQPQPRHLDLKTHALKQSKKNTMRPRQQRDALPLSFTRQDVDATRPSGFVSSSKSSKVTKLTGKIVSLNLPLMEWSIGATVSSRELTTEPLVDLVLESEFLKVRDASGSTQFEIQTKKSSFADIKFVDINKTTTSEPLIQICPSFLATLQNHARYKFDPGSTGPEGLLTFKFDTSAGDWDGTVYTALVQKLVDALTPEVQKSILDGPAARAVWEAAKRVHENPLVSIDPVPTLLDTHKENPFIPPSRPLPRLRPPGTAIEAPVRRSARLSTGEQKRSYSPRLDPDEVILGYRSGTGSLNITNGDVSRLKPGEFLNDTLIEFGLKLWLADLQESNPELASQVHVFSSFFYKKLSTKIPEEGYNSVKKWTSKFDLFQKKYIIVPINENLHWYLAIIYFPEYTLLPRPVKEAKRIAHPRRSTRRLGVIIDSSDDLQPDPAPTLSLPPDPDPPPNGQVHTGSRHESIDPETPKTDDRKDEIDVELMVESELVQDPTAKPPGAASPDTLVTQFPESPTLVYPYSSPPSHTVMLPTLDSQADGVGQVKYLEPSGKSEGDTIRTSGIPPSTFYGTKSQGRRDVTPQHAPINNSAPPPEIEIDEDETMGNPESEVEEATEHPRTYIYTFDSLATKHPQAVKRLSRYLLMEARDKKQLDEATRNEPKGTQAIVPDQPNYCDCGIYLLHFARTFMKDPKLSSDIIRCSSPQKGRRVPPHEHWDGASVGSYRDELTARIHSMSDEWKRQRSEPNSGLGTKNETDVGASNSAAPQEQQQQQQPQQPQQQQPRGGDPTPATSSKADNDSDSDIEVLCTPQKPQLSKASRKDSGTSEPRRHAARRLRG